MNTQDHPLAARNKFEQICPDCNGSEFVEDHSQGDLICEGCGRVVEAHSIDERSEWRSFGDKDSNAVDPNRVGGPSNPLLDDGGLSTVVGAASKGGTGSGMALAHNLQRLHARGDSTNKTLLSAFSRIGDICDRLSLVRAIKDHANEIFKKATDAKATKGRANLAVFAAVVYIACRRENMPRTFKEIVAVIPEASKKDIGRAYKQIVAGLELEQAKVSMHPGDLMRRFCSSLGLNNTDMNAATAVAEAAVPKRESDTAGRELRPWDGKSPPSIAAAIIMMITYLPKASGHPTLEEISVVAGMAEGTIRAAYRDLLPYAHSFVPPSYATPRDIDSLLSAAGINRAV